MPVGPPTQGGQCLAVVGTCCTFVGSAFAVQYGLGGCLQDTALRWKGRGTYLHLHVDITPAPCLEKVGCARD